MKQSFLVIEASAGSGKTYSLAKRYINIIKNHPISSTIAITFTNKAAAEMKERIILFLKKLSSTEKTEELNNEEFSLDNKRALELLVNIVKNYDDFKVMTIDSFMNRIMRALAFDLQINPDYEVTFKSDEIFEMALKDMLLNPSIKPHILNFLKIRLSLGDKGMDGVSIISRALKKLTNISLTTNSYLLKETLIDKIKSYLNLKDEIDENNLTSLIEKRMKKTLARIERNYKKEKGKYNLNRTKNGFLEEWNKALEKIDNFNEICQKGLGSFLKKKAKQPLLYQKSTEKLACYLFSCYKLKTIYENYRDANSILNTLIFWENSRKEIEKSLNIVEGHTIAKRIADILNDTDRGVGYTFCRLGEKISHYLIDEFQDTSREQFTAMEPLIENALSEGGTLFVVGDKKQAIYAWRGGDYRIFNRIVKHFSSSQPSVLNLINNYRSLSNIVNFNNEIFNPDNLALKKIEETFKEYGDPKDIIKEIYNVYNNVKQNAKRGEGGYIKVILKKEDNSEHKYEFYRKTLLETLKKLLENGIRQNQIMILLRRKENINTVVSWISETFENINIITEDSLELKKNQQIKKLLLLTSAIIYDKDESYREALKEVWQNINVENIKNEVKHLSLYEIVIYLLSKFDFNYKENELYINTLLEEILKLSKEGRSKEEIIEKLYSNPTTITLSEKLDAIKVMTIHKSKGLQSHTVILPFYDWRIYNAKKEIFEYIKISKKHDNLFDSHIFANAAKLKKILKNASEIYYSHASADLIEALNLMYVANTRAENNLIIIGSYKLTSKGEIPKNITAANILKKSLERELTLNNTEKTEIYEKGEILKDRNKEIALKTEENLTTSSGFYPNIREKLRIEPTINTYESEDERKIGDLFHLSMSLIKKIDKKILKEIAEKSYERATKIAGYSEDKIKTMIYNTLEDLYDYFSGIDRCFNEKEFVDNNGEILRPDRIVIKNGHFFIIEYKTGKKLESHKKQIKKYMKLFENSKGIIYYCKKREIVWV